MHGAGVTTQSINGSLAPVGADWTGGLVRLSRDVLSQKDDRLMAYQDVSKYVESRLEAWLNLVIFRLPMASHTGRVGVVGGRLFELPPRRRGEIRPGATLLSR